MLVLTGATGFVGSQLLRKLSPNADPLVVSRDAATARLCFPNAKICGYGDLLDVDLTGAVVIHLAARNNNRPGTQEEFQAANVRDLIEVATVSKQRGAVRFINLCSTHALKAGDDDFYGTSKREGAQLLSRIWPEAAVNLYVPAIYGEGFRGRLATLNRLPGLLRRIVMAGLRQIKPTLSIDCLHATLLRLVTEHNDPSDSWRSERYAADHVPRFGIYATLKRAIDLSAVVAVIALAGWAMILIALVIRIDSRGPAIFAQQRVGRYGRIFTCYKFRTMSLGTVDAATHDVCATSVTKVGKFLRRNKLDELPQIFNVLMNEMSLVGPRPCLPLQTELVARRGARGVLDLKPGITGLSQIADIDMGDPARLAAWDDRYRAFRTSVGDIAILIKTVLGGGTGDRIRF